MDTEKMKCIYQDEDFLLGQQADKCYLCIGKKTYELSSNPYEPCLFIEGAEGSSLTIHNAFTVDELCRTAQADGSIKMVTGDEYDLPGIGMLLRKAVTLSRESVDIGYLEGCCFMDHLKEQGAVSEESAVKLTDRIRNQNVLNPLLHAKKIGRTNDARYYLAGHNTTDSAPDTGRSMRVISNQVRFGCGYRTINGIRQYFAWHGYPNRNDDFFTTSEISQSEYDMISEEYPEEICADRETAETFRNKYVDGHPVLLEGWNKLL